MSTWCLYYRLADCSIKMSEVLGDIDKTSAATVVSHCITCTYPTGIR